MTKDEISDLDRLYTQFFPNIFKISDNLWSYDGYLLPWQIGNVEVFWYKHSMNMFEPQTLATIKNKDIIDVGASIGDSALIFENEFCDKNIYSFEPTKQRYELMLRTIKLNKTSRIIPINKALGSQETTMIMDNDVTSISYITNNKTTEVVEVTTLDNFVREHNLSIGLIKVDTEGFEMEFLKGAKETICAQKPAMLLSIYHSGKDYFGIKPLIESWNLGYKFKIYKGTDRTITEETMLFCEIIE